MKEKLKALLGVIVCGAAAVFFFVNMNDWEIVLFGLIPIPHTGIIIAIFFAVATLGALIGLFEKPKDSKDKEEIKEKEKP